jgi:hypothetical protein
MDEESQSYVDPELVEALRSALTVHGLDKLRGQIEKALDALRDEGVIPFAECPHGQDIRRCRLCAMAAMYPVSRHTKDIEKQLIEGLKKTAEESFVGDKLTIINPDTEPMPNNGEKMPKGIVTYNPKHRVSPRKELAIKRTHAQEGFSLIVRGFPWQLRMWGPSCDWAAYQLRAIPEDFHHWMVSSTHPTPEDDINKLYWYLEQWVVIVQDPETVTAIKTFLDKVESKMCKTTTHPWTAILKVDNLSIAPYLQELKEQGIKVTPSAWGPHITWVNKEEPHNKGNWEAYQNIPIKFELKPEIKTNGTYYWLDIECNDLKLMRRALGLKPEPKIPFHLTIGKKVKDD